MKNVSFPCTYIQEEAKIQMLFLCFSTVFQANNKRSNCSKSLYTGGNNFLKLVQISGIRILFVEPPHIVKICNRKDLTYTVHTCIYHCTHSCKTHRHYTDVLMNSHKAANRLFPTYIIGAQGGSCSRDLFAASEARSQLR